MSHCPSCGGMIGRDCFNPEECAWITQEMEQRAQWIECEYCGGTGSIYVDFEHPQYITCEACK